MSRGYSGIATFDFEVEGENGETIVLHVTGNSKFFPGNYFGRPEDCYEDDSETEIESIIGPNNEDWMDKITEKESQQIIKEIEERVAEYSNQDDYDEDA